MERLNSMGQDSLTPAKFYHRQLVESVIAKKIAGINLEIEEAAENDKKRLLQARKSLKDQMHYDDSNWDTIDDLKTHLDKVKAL